jgi:hypothetical protein
LSPATTQFVQDCRIPPQSTDGLLSPSFKCTSCTVVYIAPPPCCPMLPCRCRAALPLCQRCHRTVAANTALLPRCCYRRPCAADFAATLPTVAMLLLHSLRHSANAATALPLLTLRCRCCCHAACRCRAAVSLLLPTLPPRCQHHHHAVNAPTALPPPAHCL